MKRLLLALVPVALLATSTLAYPDLSIESSPIQLASGDAVTVTTTSPTAPSAAAPVVAQVAPTAPTPSSQPVVQQQAPPPPAPTVVEESLPLVVNTSDLVEALSVLVRATEEAKLAITALDAEAQQMHIQSTINLLAGSSAVQFKQTTMTASGTYSGVDTLLTQALQAREEAEARWVAALDERDAQFYVAGPGGTLPPATVTAKFGTAGLRPEEQARLLVDRAILQAVQALRLASAPAERAVSREDGVSATWTSDEAGVLLESVVKMLDAAMKIVQIAINR